MFELYGYKNNQFYFIDVETEKDYTFEVDRGSLKNLRDEQTGKVIARTYRSAKAKLGMKAGENTKRSGDFAEIVLKANRYLESIRK